MTDEERDRIMDKINKLTSDDVFMTELEAREWDKWEENSKIDYAEKKGIEQNTIDMIKSMAENNATLEFISKVTNKSIEEIKEIIEGK